MKDRKHNYVVGFIGEGQCVYGKDWKTSFQAQPGASSFTDPMTLTQAKRQLKKLHTAPDAKATIYRLVPVKGK